MKIIEGDIPGLLILEPVIYKDDRGSFMEVFNEELLAKLDFHEHFVQDNESVSAKGVIRALHFQNPPMAQGKLVRVVQGSILDVAVDIRRGSPWYGMHQKALLSAENRLMFWLPPGFAHGFVALEDNTIVNYKCTNAFSREHEGSIRWNDSTLGIDWVTEHPLLSDRDLNAPLFHNHTGEFVYDGK